MTLHLLSHIFQLKAASEIESLTANNSVTEKVIWICEESK